MLPSSIFGSEVISSPEWHAPPAVRSKSRMFTMKCSSAQLRLFVAIAAAFTINGIHSATAQTSVSPQSMKVLGEVDPRFVSYNVEAVEVTGGRFWAPYKSSAEKAAAAAPET